MLQLLPIRYLTGALAVLIGVLMICLPVQAASLDPYVAQYLQVKDPVPLAMDATGQTQEFSAADLTAGKQLFEENCKNCHVGGATLPDPLVSLSLEDLKRATPARDHITGLVAFLRQPMTYDGTEESFWCRQIPESWMSETQLQNLSAFVLRAAQKAPGWGTDHF